MSSISIINYYKLKPTQHGYKMVIEACAPRLCLRPFKVLKVPANLDGSPDYGPCLCFRRNKGMFRDSQPPFPKKGMLPRRPTPRPPSKQGGSAFRLAQPKDRPQTRQNPCFRGRWGGWTLRLDLKKKPAATIPCSLRCGPEIFEDPVTMWFHAYWFQMFGFQV